MIEIDRLLLEIIQLKGEVACLKNKRQEDGEMKITAILGAGQVANTLKNNITNESTMYDIGQWEGEEHIECDYLHIAIPYTKGFIRIVENAERIFSPDIMLIHSSVKPGTTKKLKCLYSPVIGRHDDDFKNNVKLYRKFIAGDKASYDKVSNLFNLQCEYWGENTSELEYSKIMSTSRMYWDLMFQKIMQRDCEKYDYDFIQAYHRWTDNYNAGIAVNHPNWKRPFYLKMETDTPGGHCLKSNIHLVDNELTAIIKAWEKDLQ